MSLLILGYHDIVSKIPEFHDRWTISPDLFRSQLQWLEEAGYQIMSEQKLEERSVQGLSMEILSENKHVLLTFDDGLQSHLDFVAPVLTREGLGGIFFICFGYMYGTVRPPLRVKQYLTPELVEALGSLPGCLLGGHSMTHPLFDRLTLQDIAYEIRTSLELTELYSAYYPENRQVYFATPHGFYSRQIVDIACICGADEIFTTEPGINASKKSKLLGCSISVLKRWEIRNDETSTKEDFFKKLQEVENIP